MNQDKIGKFIKEARIKDKLSQEKFGEKYGVTYQAVSKWENGVSNVKWHTIRKLKIYFILKGKMKTYILS